MNGVMDMAKTDREIAEKILNDNLVGTMATIEGNKPHTRYMTFYNDNLTLYTVTSKDTHKVEELSNNPYVHILIGYDGKGFGDAYLEIEGKAEASSDEGMKEKVWNKVLKFWFDGPDDPNMVVIKIVPSQIRIMNSKGKEPKVIQL